ncbi:MAG: hypothetical protein R6X19_07100 [Kiritimatiellia bacterium]
MIVPMKKVTILSLADHRDESLNALRELGVLHVSPLRSAPAGDLETARRHLEEAQAVLVVLRRLAAENPGAPSPAGPISPAEVLAEALRLTAAIRERAETLLRLNDRVKHLAPYGDFDPAELRELIARGISIRLFRAESRADIQLPEGAVRVDLHRDNTAVFFALLNAPGWTGNAVEMPVPERALGDVRRERTQVEADQAADGKALAQLASRLNLAEKAAADALDRVRWLEARNGMGQDGAVLLIQGFMPAPDLPTLQAEAKRQGWGWLAEDPTEADAVPTLIRYSRWTRPIQSLMDMLGIVPGYWELDVSPVFLIFFSLFFAMLVGDAVYGLLFLGLTFLIRKKWKAAPPSLVPLLTILSLSTMVWGVLSGSYLGIEALPGPLRKLKLDMLTDTTRIEHICFLLGASQMSLAHAWCIVRNPRSITALAQLGWIGSCWMMYSLAENLILGKPHLPGIFWIFGVSVFLIFAFTVPFKKFKTDYQSLLNVPFSIIGHFGDTISYLRLYLVASSSVVLIKAFNEIAFGGDAPMTLGRGLAGAVIIFLVHLLNILLSALSVLVHGVRLNALEFSSHLGIQWLGRHFNPFRKESAPTP